MTDIPANAVDELAVRLTLIRACAAAGSQSRFPHTDSPGGNGG